jgi:hypothetical protein
MRVPRSKRTRIAVFAGGCFAVVAANLIFLSWLALQQ